jgi:hypothetical protein
LAKPAERDLIRLRRKTADKVNEWHIQQMSCEVGQDPWVAAGLFLSKSSCFITAILQFVSKMKQFGYKSKPVLSK